MTTSTFDRATYGTMSVKQLKTKFLEIVGEAPEKLNKLWMLKRMEQAASARAASERAARRPRRGHETLEAPAAIVAEPAREVPATTDDIAPSAEGVAASIAVEATAVASVLPETQPEVESATSNDAPPPPDPAEPEEAAEASPVARPDTLEAAPAADGPPDGEPAAAAAQTQRESRDESPESGPSAAAPSEPALEAAARLPRGNRYVPREYKAKTLAEILEIFERVVKRPTKSTDIPYLVWRIMRAGRQVDGAPAAATRRNSVGADGVPRGEAKAITLREYEDTLQALKGVCERHGFRNRLDLLRRAAGHFLLTLGEPEAAAFFALPPATKEESPGVSAAASE